MKKRTKGLIVLIVLIAAAAAGFLAFAPREEAISEIAAYRGTVETYYNFEGHITAPGQQTITAGAPDTVREVYVQANMQVKKDDRLLKLENAGTVRADRAGEVTTLSVQADDTVSAGQTLAQIVDLSRLEIEIKVDEYDISAIDLGESAQVTVEAVDQVIEASVSKINKVSSGTGDLSYYMVTLSFDAQQAPGVLPGMRVSAKVLNERAQDVTLLAMSALRFDDYNQPYVLMRSGDEKRTVQVGVGISDGVNVEITSGVVPGDLVIDGARMGSMVEQMMKMREQMMGM